MGKLTAFCGSPRGNGFTMKLIRQVLSGAEAEGMETKLYNLNEPGIRGCQHCYYCREHEGCAVKDPLSGMYRDIVESEAIVFGCPIYFYQISGQAKIWMDRMFPMFDTPGFAARYPGKKVVSIFAQGFEDPKLYEKVFDEMNAHFVTWGWKVEETIVKAGKDSLEEEMLKRAFEAGRRLVHEEQK